MPHRYAVLYGDGGNQAINGRTDCDSLPAARSEPVRGYQEQVQRNRVARHRKGKERLPFETALSIEKFNLGGGIRQNHFRPRFLR
jgi:hypothetical protein